VSLSLHAQQALFDLPPLPEPQNFGNILIDRLASTGNSVPVGFSHWSHRTRYTCRVCHFELDFALQRNGSEITEDDNRTGLFCGSCHNGEEAFGHEESHCTKCHTGTAISEKRDFKRSLKRLPSAPFGNQVDWVAAERNEQIRPLKSLFEPDFEPIPFKEEFAVDAAWTLIPPADFSHDVHLRWLECSNCHPHIFKIEKEGTEHFLMKNILEGRFCGVCHQSVAFPLNDCKRCHPDMKGN
jgi:c(7)-type cytochrome triheme protein